MKIEIAPIDSIKPYPKNPRINDNAIDKVANSIKEFGFKQPIVVDKDRVIIAGHTRHKAGYSLGLKEVPIVIADDLTKAQIKAYRLADNRVAQDSKWENNLLSEEILELRDDLNFDISLLGFETLEIKNLLNENDIEEINDKIFDRTEYNVLIECSSEYEQQKLYEEILARGYKCKLIM